MILEMFCVLFLSYDNCRVSLNVGAITRTTKFWTGRRLPSTHPIITLLNSEVLSDCSRTVDFFFSSL